MHLLQAKSHLKVLQAIDLEHHHRAVLELMLVGAGRWAQLEEQDGAVGTGEAVQIRQAGVEEEEVLPVVDHHHLENVKENVNGTGTEMIVVCRLHVVVRPLDEDMGVRAVLPAEGIDRVHEKLIPCSVLLPALSLDRFHAIS